VPENGKPGNLQFCKAGVSLPPGQGSNRCIKRKEETPTGVPRHQQTLGAAITRVNNQVYIIAQESKKHPGDDLAESPIVSSRFHALHNEAA
jgi:hypothetical protein